MKRYNVGWLDKGWDEPEVHYIPCPECNGEGGEWYNSENGENYTQLQYLKLSGEDKEKIKFEKCGLCGGSGLIIDEHSADDIEPDYYD